MRKFCSKVLVFTLIIGSLLPVQPKAAENSVQNSKIASQSVKILPNVYAAKPKKSGLTLNKELITDLSLDYGAINKKAGGKLQPDDAGHGEYYAEIPYRKNLTYYFNAFDPELKYELKDDSPCMRAEGPLNEIFSGFKKNTGEKMSLKSFIKLLKKKNYNVKYKVLKGYGTSYYIADDYVEVTFKVKKSDKKTYCLNLAISSNKDTSLSLYSQAWLFIN